NELMDTFSDGKIPNGSDYADLIDSTHYSTLYGEMIATNSRTTGITFNDNIFNRNDSFIDNTDLGPDGEFITNNSKILFFIPNISESTQYYATAGFQYALMNSEDEIISAGLATLSNGLKTVKGTVSMYIAINRSFRARFMLAKTDTRINADDHYIQFGINYHNGTKIGIESLTESDATNTFVESMNEKASLIGMNDTEFHNPHGLGT